MEQEPHAVATYILGWEGLLPPLDTFPLAGPTIRKRDDVLREHDNVAAVDTSHRRFRSFQSSIHVCIDSWPSNYVCMHALQDQIYLHR